MMKVWTAFLVIGAAASVVAWAVALCHENRVCPFAAAARFVRGLPWGGRLALLPLFVALIVYGGTKNSGGVGSGGVGELGVEGTNQVSGRVESVEGVDNVANVEVLPIPTTFAKATAVRMLPVANCSIMPPPQLKIGLGKWQHFHIGNIFPNTYPAERLHSADRHQSDFRSRSYHTDFMPILYHF